MFLYSFFIRLYVLLVRLAALRNPKARAWIEGRRGWSDRLAAALAPADRVIWVHCASAGELEQGKPLIEALRRRYPRHRVLLSFFSPSGFTTAGKWAAANDIIITYLPADTRANAQRFLSIVHPELAVFVKYEYWHYHLSEARKRNVPLLLVSAIFRPDQVFFRWYGGFFRTILFLFTRIFVQDEASAERLRPLGLEAAVAGDTRFDRVLRIVEAPVEIPVVKTLAAKGPLVIAGSTWPEDEALFVRLHAATGARLVLAPHELNKAHLDDLRRRFPAAAFYTELAPGAAIDAQVLVIDTFGLLSQLYQYATVTYVGGGFNKSGIHNTLEAAVWGKPVLFGPQYQKFREARDLVRGGGAFAITDENEFIETAKRLLEDARACAEAGATAGAYVRSGAGATERIMNYIQENRLLTN